MPPVSIMKGLKADDEDDFPMPMHCYVPVVREMNQTQLKLSDFPKALEASLKHLTIKKCRISETDEIECPTLVCVLCENLCENTDGLLKHIISEHADEKTKAIHEELGVIPENVQRKIDEACNEQKDGSTFKLKFKDSHTHRVSMPVNCPIFPFVNRTRAQVFLKGCPSGAKPSFKAQVYCPETKEWNEVFFAFGYCFKREEAHRRRKRMRIVYKWKFHPTSFLPEFHSLSDIDKQEVISILKLSEPYNDKDLVEAVKNVPLVEQKNREIRFKQAPRGKGQAEKPKEEPKVDNTKRMRMTIM